MSTMNISIPTPMKDWVKTQIDTGKYAGSSDYIRDLIRRDQTRQEKVEAMQNAINIGLESGIPQDFDLESFKKRMINSFNEA